MRRLACVAQLQTRSESRACAVCSDITCAAKALPSLALTGGLPQVKDAAKDAGNKASSKADSASDEAGAWACSLLRLLQLL